MSADIVYLAWNRLEFTTATFGLLLRNTNWDLVNRLIVYDDGSSDGTRRWLDENIHRCPVETHLIHLGWHSPVLTMIHHLGTGAGDFVKLDNDIAVPPRWLDELLATADAHPDVMLLGMEAGQTELPGRNGGPPAPFPRGVADASWIGGIGLIRAAPFRRSKPTARGRFGFTEWQQANQWVRRGWIAPDLLVPQLDRIPEKPWRTYSQQYVGRGWQRDWPLYDATWAAPYYQWFLDENL